MRKSRFTDEQIVGFLKQAEAGLPVKELCRKGGFSDATFYKWRARFGGMEASDARMLREVQAENTKLKKLLAEAHLDIHALNGSIARPTWASTSNGSGRWRGPGQPSPPGDKTATRSGRTAAATPAVQRLTSTWRDSGSIHIATRLTALIATTYQATCSGS